LAGGLLIVFPPILLGKYAFRSSYV
jgi:hypothetical protein